MNTADIEIPFDHQQSAHCESGAIASLLRHAGLPISEPMAFGIGGALAFAYLPFVKFGGMPLIAYRMPPGSLISGLTRRLGVRMHTQTFGNADAGMRALDESLAAGRPAGVQSSAYWLGYFPPDMRFHFNAHNLVVYGCRNGRYLISDPVIDIRVDCAADELRKARFTRGVMAPRGRLYYPLHVPANPDWRRAVRKAIRHTANMMLRTPLPLIGVHGIRTLARKLRRLDAQNERYNKLFLGNIVRMQEEIGTGGAGFRFLYASFLQEAAPLLDRSGLDDAARALSIAGDAWRAFALEAAKICKERSEADYSVLAAQLIDCADRETTVYRRLRAETN